MDEPTERDLLAQAIYDRVRPQQWAPTAMTDFGECVSAADAVLSSEWLAKRDAAIRQEGAELGYQRALDNAIVHIQTDTNPRGRYGSLNEGSRSTWFSHGLTEAVRRLTIMKGLPKE